MATSSSKIAGTSAGSITRRYDDDEARDNVTSIGDFFRGEWAVLWPAWVVFLLMVAVIVWDRLVQF